MSGNDSDQYWILSIIAVLILMLVGGLSISIFMQIRAEKKQEDAAVANFAQDLSALDYSNPTFLPERSAGALKVTAFVVINGCELVLTRDLTPKETTNKPALNGQIIETFKVKGVVAGEGRIDYISNFPSTPHKNDIAVRIAGNPLFNHCRIPA